MATRTRTRGVATAKKAATKKVKAKTVTSSTRSTSSASSGTGAGKGKAKAAKGKGKKGKSADAEAMKEEVLVVETSALEEPLVVRELRTEVLRLEAQLKGLTEAIGDNACDECFECLSCKAPEGVNLARPPQSSTTKPKEPTPEEPKDLHEAVRQNNYNIIEKLCRSGIDVNARDENFLTALDYAQDEGAARILCDVGKCDPNLMDNHLGCTALSRNAYEGSHDVVRYLASHPKCQINKLDMEGKSALDRAMQAHEEFGESHQFSLINFLKTKGAKTGREILSQPSGGPDGEADGTPVYLNVRYESKDIAKSYGAKWDMDKRSWYIGPRASRADKEFLIGTFGTKNVWW